MILYFLTLVRYQFCSTFHYAYVIVLVKASATYAETGDVMLTCDIFTSKPDKWNCSWFSDNSLVIDDVTHTVWPQSNHRRQLTIRRGTLIAGQYDRLLLA